MKATKDLYRDLVLNMPTRSRPTITYREMMADSNSAAEKESAPDINNAASSGAEEGTAASTSSPSILPPPPPPATLLSNETGTERWMTYCVECSRILIWTRRFAHVSDTIAHKKMTTPARAELISSLERRRKLCKLKEPVKKSQAILPSLLADEGIFDEEEQAPPRQKGAGSSSNERDRWEQE